MPRYAVPQLYDAIHAVSTTEYLRWLANNDIFLFKRFCAIYSSKQVTSWLNQ